MKPATNSLTEIFNADVRYVVPLYQRPYVWNRDGHWEPLWEDIGVVLDHYLEEAEEPMRHFLGAIVLDQQDTPPGEPVRRLVIDGQQRLTTLQLLMAAAARAASSDGCERQARLLTKLTQNDPDLATGDERFKVWPTNANQAAFRDVMQGDRRAVGAAKDPGNTIHEAYAYFSEVIRSWVHTGGPNADQIRERHEALRVVVSGLLQVVSINLEPGDNPQVIFETLNARGTPLLAMDLVKNAVFYRAQRARSDVDHLNGSVWEPELGQEYWRQSIRQGRLNRPRAELFLMHWLAMKLGRMIPATELFSQFRAHILDAPVTPDMDRLIHELCRDAAVMRGFDGQPTGTVEAQFFRHLDALDTTTVLPVALLLYRSGELSADQRRLGLRALESWLVRRMLCGYTAANYNRLIADLLKQLAVDVVHADEIIVRFLRSSAATTAVWPSDETLIHSLTGRRLYGWVSQKRIVMVLSSLEMELRKSNKVEDIYALPSNLTIEHIMPQTWAEHWAADGVVDADQREAHVHLLGNLTLTSGPLNSSLSNASWEVKRGALATHSLLLLNRDITRCDTWDEALIDQRGRRLAHEICELWPGPHADLWREAVGLGFTATLTQSPAPPAVDATSEGRRIDNSGLRAGHDNLATLVDRFRREHGYPRQKDTDQIAAREELLDTLARPSLDSIATDLSMSDVGAFRRIASDAYGGPGNQVQLNVHLNSGPQAVAELARSIRHLLYGPGREVDRLDDVLEHSAWKVRGFGEALAVKCLAIVYPDRWLPLFLYPGENGKRAIMQLNELPVEPLEERGRSRAELAKESNDILRELLKPYFGDDSWGPVQFLWWLLQSTHTNQPNDARQIASDKNQ